MVEWLDCSIVRRHKKAPGDSGAFYFSLFVYAAGITGKYLKAESDIG
jgi:hypothetical protein